MSELLLPLIRLFFNIFFIVFFVAWYSFKAVAFVDPQIKWQQIDTEHFTIIFDAESLNIAKDYARYAESSYSLAFPLFKEAPAKTIIVINDVTDVANGYATRIPYPLIMVYPTLPTSLDSINYFGNWGHELLIHEYTHILSFEPARGFIKPLRYVFGNIMSPNMLLPTWWLEGIAVFNETYLTAHGRLRSPYFDATVRSFVEASDINHFNISQINDQLNPDWPGNRRPYFYGSYIWQQLIKEHGLNAIENLHQRYGGRVPYFFNGPMTDLTGINYEKFFAKTLDQMSAAAAKQIAKINSQSQSKPVPFKIASIETHSATISPDGLKLLFVERTDAGTWAVRMLERSDDKLVSFADVSETKNLVNESEPLAEPNSSDVPMGKSINKVSWFPGSTKFVFDQVKVFNYYYTFSDLYLHDLTTDSTTALTSGMRAKEPAVSPLGSDIVFVKAQKAQTTLCLLASDGSNLRELYTTPFQYRISRPEFLNGSQIVFTERDNDGNEFLKLYDIPTQKITKLLTNYKNPQFAHLTKYGLLFAANNNGVTNLYLSTDNFTKTYPLTNETTGTMTGEIDFITNELYYSRFTNKGIELVKLPREAWMSQTTSLPEITNLSTIESPELNKGQTNQVAINNSQGLAVTPEPYMGWKYLLPRYWIPFVYFTEDATILQVSTMGKDPLDKHIYSLQADWDSTNHTTGFNIYYSNSANAIKYDFLFGDTYDDLADVDGDLHDTDISVAARFYLPKFDYHYQGSVGWTHRRRQAYGLIDSIRFGPTLLLSYTNLSQSGQQISPETGGSYLLSLTHFMETTDAVSKTKEPGYSQLLASYTKFYSQILPKHHVFMTHLKALYTPQTVEFIYGSSTSGSPIGSGVISNTFLTRGYPTGAFLGRSLLNCNFEYRFPLKDLYKGWSTKPVFLRRIYGAALIDTLNVDGIFYNPATKQFFRTERADVFASGGFEIKLDSEIGYHLPLKVFWGFYYGLEAKAGGEFTTMIGLSI